MNQLAKWIVGVIVVVAVVAVGFFIYKGPDQIPASTFKVGLILPLTGDVASLGENAKSGTNLAYNDLPESIKQKMQLIFEDDGFQPKNTVSAFNKLVETDRVNVIICFTSGPCGAVAPLADQKQVPLIAVASAPVQKDRKFVVRLEISTTEEAKKLLQFIKEKGYARVASIVAIQDGIQAGYKVLASDPDFSAKEVASESVKPDEKDFRTLISKLVSKKPDLIFVGLLPGMAGEFGKQARVLGYKGDFIGFNFVEGEETLEAAQGSLDGIVFTQAADSESWFAEKYKSAYNKSIGPGSAHMYDAMNILADAIVKDSVSNAELNYYLNHIQNFRGALGEYGSTDSHEFTLPLVLRTIRDNQFAPY